MRKLFPHIVLLLAGILAGCAAKEVLVPEKSGALEMKGVQAVIVDGTPTKAGTVTPLVDYVGRSKFKGNDQIVFTKICRTDTPLDAFTYPGSGDTYTGIVFKAGNEGGEASGWQRQTSDGGPERIYWTDAASEHTFIAYGVPQDNAYDWKSHVHTAESTSKTYYIGSLGDPLVTGDIDFSLTTEEQASYTAQENNVTVYKNPKLENEDLVIAYDTHMHAEPGGSVALVQFYHALSSVRVVVNISGFSSSSTAADNEAVVSDMVLLHQPTMYAWEQSDFGVQPLRSEDQAIIDGAWSDSNTKPDYDQRKNIKLWIPRPAGSGSNQSKTFTFYGITTPQPQNYISTLEDNDANRSAELSFKVTYPNPLKPSTTVTSTYKASLKDVCFDAGYNTTINISLNHKNEKMTVGAEYENWQFVATPDVSELFKNSTFLQDTDRWVTGTANIPNVTIVGDEKATADDATWLYKSGDKILDIYGHDGSSIVQAYQISTAYQLLSFAYEVKAGRDFTGKFIRLDADLTLQKSSDKTKEELPTDDEAYSTAADAIAWIGIGESGKPFNGTFLGGDRYIYSLYGKPLFAELGPKAQILKLQVSTIQKADQSASVTGGGLLADSNAGLISACKMDGDVTLSGSPAGAFVGINNGTVYASYHIGATNGSSTTGGLVGKNTGTVRNCYQVGKVTGSTTGGIAGENSGTLNTTYYNSSLLPSPTATFEGATGKSTLEMTMPGFVTALNIGIGEFSSGTAPGDLWSYVLRPADYPKIGDYVQLNGWLETDLHLITAASDRFVIVGNNGSNYAMTNDNGDSASPLAQPVTVKDGAVTGDVPSNLQWTLTGSASGYSFHPFGYDAAYLYVSDLGVSNRNVNVREESDRGSFTIEDGFLKETVSSRFLGIYDSSEWRSYTSHTNKTDNINNQVFRFYKFYADDKNAALTLAHAGKVSMGDGAFNLDITNPNNVTYTLTSSDASIAEVNSAGTITVKKAGKVTITAAWVEQNGYREGQYNYILTVWKTTPVVSFTETTASIDMKDGTTLTRTATTTPSGVALTYTSDNPSVATVNASTGEVTALKRGTAVITATVADLANYESASASYTLNVTDTRSFAVKFSASPVASGTVSASAGGTALASGGSVQVGTTVTLTATPASGHTFRSWRVSKSDDPSIVETVTNNSFVMPGYPVTVTGYFMHEDVDDYYVKVGSGEAITEGDYLIVYEENATTAHVLSGIRSDNTGDYATVTVTDAGIAWSTAQAYNITVGESASTPNQFRMKLGNSYLAYTGSDNKLYAFDNPYATGTLWTLSYNSALNIAASGRSLQWNNSANPKRFCCYTSSQGSISLYKLQGHRYQIAIADGITGGSVSTSPASLAEEGATVTLTATPSTGYAFASWNVYKTGESTTAVTVDGNTFNMPAYNVTVSATFNTVPTINLLKTAIDNVRYEGVTDASETGVYEFLNGATDESVTVTCDGTVVTAAVKNNGDITYTVAVNTKTARSGWIRIQYGSNPAHEITVSQQGNPSFKPTENVTAGTFNSADNKLTLTTGSGVTIEQSKVSGSTAVNSDYNTVPTLRVYQGHALTFSGKTFTRIEIVVNGTYYGNTLTANTGTLTPTTTSGGTIIWEGSSDSVVITNTVTENNVQLRTTSFALYY